MLPNRSDVFDVAVREGGTTLATSDAEAVIGWLRTTKDETLLAVVNTSAEPVTGYSLGLQDGPLCAEAAATLVGSIGGDPGATVASLTVNATGGFDRWTPLAVLPPRSGYLISLAPAP